MHVPRLFALGLAALCVSCGPSKLDVNIPFAVSWNGEPLSCNGATTTLTDLRFYINDARLVAADGTHRDIVLAPDQTWQNDAVALIDLEDGTGACDNGTAETNAMLVGSVRNGDYRGLQFTIGVPFELNHANPLTAIPPLDDPEMHWHWRSGYKFLRAGIRTADDGFWIHAGSTGCEGTVGAITGCRFPNRILVELDDFVPGESRVVVDLAMLVASVALDDGNATDCSSGPAEAACIAPFGALGIDFESGRQAGAQVVFSVQ